MRQWITVVAVVCGILSTSGASANVWGKAQVGEKTSSSGYKPTMLACGKMVMKREISQDHSPAAKQAPKASTAGSALVTSR